MLNKEALTFALFTSFCSTENKVVSVFVITQCPAAYRIVLTNIEGSYIDVAYADSYYEK